MATNKKTTTKPVVEEVVETAVEIPVDEKKPAKAELNTAIVLPDKLNFRSEADVTGEVISVLEKDAKVKLTGNVKGAWSEIKVGNKTGFVMTEYIKTV